MRPYLLPMMGLTAFVAACGGDSSGSSSGFRLLGGSGIDVHPTIANAELPFKYPAALYARQVQGNVLLRLYIDSTGRVLPESTRVEESSGEHGLDSAAIAASRELMFTPARRDDEAVGVTVLFPVYFRHPEAEPLPGDSILLQQADSARVTP